VQCIGIDPTYAEGLREALTEAGFLDKWSRRYRGLNT
jgi:hypothetical protein